MKDLDITCVISGSETGGKVAVFEEVVAPASGPPRHTHRNQLEVFHVLEGRIRFEVDGEVLVREAGSVAVVPAGAVHAFRNDGGESARIRFELLPAGSSEEGFRLLLAGEVEDVGAFFDQYDMDLVGPPLDAP